MAEVGRQNVAWGLCGLGLNLFRRFFVGDCASTFDAINRTGPEGGGNASCLVLITATQGRDDVSVFSV